MKLKLIAAALLAASSMAFADTSATVTYGRQEADSSKAMSDVYKLDVKTSLTKQIDGDVSILNTATDSANTVSSRYEAGVTGKMGLIGDNFITSYARVAVGERITGGKNFAYYSVEPGVIVKTPVEGLTAKLGYRFRTAFASGNSDTTNSIRYSLGYAITKKDSISLGYDDVNGDNAFNRTYVSYTRSF
jgi:hypothetical protein